MFFSLIDDSQFFCRSSVTFSQKDNSFLVLTSDRKHIIELKDVAFSIWENLAKPISFDDLLKKLNQEYDVSKEELKKDLKEWLKQALKEKIVEKKSKA